jgi:hypothetical protein
LKSLAALGGFLVVLLDTFKVVDYAELVIFNMDVFKVRILEIYTRPALLSKLPPPQRSRDGVHAPAEL